MGSHFKCLRVMARDRTQFPTHGPNTLQLRYLAIFEAKVWVKRGFLSTHARGIAARGGAKD